MLALLTPEQEMLRQMASQLAASSAPANVPDLDAVDRAKTWAALSESGLLSLRVRDTEGVPAASGVEVMLVCEAFGRALSPLPYLGCILAAELMSVAGAPDSWVEGVVSGDQRYGLLLTSNMSALAQGGDRTVLAFDVDEASYVLALSEDALVRIPFDEAFVAADAADLTRKIARPGDKLSPAELSGGRLALPDADRWLALALTAASADLVGVMSSALDKAVAYAKERVQYGVKIGSFQAIQHLCADVLVDVEASASLTRYASWAVDALNPDEGLLAARTAKAYSASVARQVTETVMQVFGGIGQTWEHAAHMHTRRALTGRMLFGDERHQLSLIADARMGA
jgi:alkylation response protein AidB-like acyl-CoA dehydrogenase